VITASCLGFLGATSRGRGWGAPVVAVSVVCTLGEILDAGSATALVTTLAPRRPSWGAPCPGSRCPRGSGWPCPRR